MKNSKAKGRIKRSIRIRAKIAGSKDRPRLCVFRSSRYIYAQIIDDVSGKTLVAASEKELNIKKGEKIKKIEKAKLVGQLLVKKAVKAKVAAVVFDRNGYKYHGRVKSLAEGVREGGLKF
ncbi:50S ribosomal protein L18 [Candidatus Gottesmanbacteria bacterium]|nr:50S ribosomal protein L18 [Candidatus Gottesmanbacteria bacterium]